MELQTLTSLVGELGRPYHVAGQGDAEFVWITDMDLRVTHVSASAEYILGYAARGTSSDGQISGAAALTTSKIHEKVLTEVQRIASNLPRDLSRPWMLQMELTRKDGSILLTETSVSLLCDRDGDPCAIVCLTRDTTKQRREQELFRTLADSSPIGV